ncbi:hypothetical protein [Candidatus Reidiella endopervernicosa]|uniref:PD40 domain-containing protein n=1 Tax=Candidatus Reidiella endopervernicosa TaxID=2738883 RepID=A0A6N0HX07_9GAMM|nr:hypothetical protein [Candidatus Reidiella endopervernicosa]QKQ26777.1 hypothetical protein HUE57_11135 [Candidatus Reidiella endopervernicosa]
MLVDEGKPQFTAEDEDRREYAAMLHVMNSDGSDIHQVSFNPSHDLDPTLLSSGKVLFSRWDNMGGRNAISLYTMRPDGGQLQLHYGAHSHNTGTDDTTVQFMRPREMPDGRLLSLIRPFNDTEDGGALIVIDTLNYIDNSGPTAANMGVLSGPAQTPATINSVSTLSGPSPGGRFRSAYPLDDGTERLLVSWSPCRLLEGTTIGPCSEAALADPDVVTAPPLYGLFIYDMSDDTQQPVVLPVEGVIFDEVVVAQPRDLPQVLYDDEGIDALLADEGVGESLFCESLFGHPSPSKQQKLNATIYAYGAPTVLRTLRNHLFAALHNSLSDSTPT